MSADIKLLWKYIGPSLIGMLIAGSFSIVDTIFIGQAMGKIGLAAVAVTWPPIMLFGAFGSLFGSGAAVLISQARGSGDERGAQKFFGGMVLLMLVSSLILGIISLGFLPQLLVLLGATPELIPQAVAYSQVMIYGIALFMLMTGVLEVVRNDGRPALSMWLLVTGLIGNIFLDWLFIIFFRWGAWGAALATVISQGIPVLLGIVYFCSPLTRLRLTWVNFKSDNKTLRNITLTGIPIFGNMLSIIAMLFMHNHQSLRYGQVDGLAAYTMVAALESLGSILMTGLAAGMQPLIAQMYGAGKFKRQNRIGVYTYWMALGFGVVLMLLSFALHSVMPGWMGLTGEAEKLASHGVVLSATAFLLLGVIRVAGFYYQSSGKILDSSLLIYGDAFFALPLCLFTLPIWFGMNGVWLAMPVSRLILFAILLYLWFGKKRDGHNGKRKISGVASGMDQNSF